MKIHILYNFHKGPLGGGNQFLKALRDEWERQGIYSQTLKEADVVILNSYPFRAEWIFNQLYLLKKKYPTKIIVYRLNGPISHIRQQDKEVDQIIAQANRIFADGIIFQSQWCAQENKTCFNIFSPYQTVIYNAPDPKIFYKKNPSTLNPNHVKLIATSWSANPRKGFDVYAYLDTHLDFSKFEMTFVGNSPIPFTNIKKIEPVSSEELAPILREHDIFITASKSDPCSNSLIEALSCGLPATALNDGGHPELVQKGGNLFEGTHDVLERIDQVVKNYQHYQNQIPFFDLTDTANQYRLFCKNILEDAKQKRYTPKQCHRMGYIQLRILILKWKINNVAKKIWKKLHL